MECNGDDPNGAFTDAGEVLMGSDTRQAVAFFDVLGERSAEKAATGMLLWLDRNLGGFAPAGATARVTDVRPANACDARTPVAPIGGLVWAALSFSDGGTPEGEVPTWLFEGLSAAHKEFRLIEVTIPGTDQTLSPSGG